MLSPEIFLLSGNVVTSADKHKEDIHRTDDGLMQLISTTWCELLLYAMLSCQVLTFWVTENPLRCTLCGFAFWTPVGWTNSWNFHLTLKQYITTFVYSIFLGHRELSYSTCFLTLLTWNTGKMKWNCEIPVYLTNPFLSAGSWCINFDSWVLNASLDNGS